MTERGKLIRCGEKKKRGEEWSKVEKKSNEWRLESSFFNSWVDRRRRKGKGVISFCS